MVPQTMTENAQILRKAVKQAIANGWWPQPQFTDVEVDKSGVIVYYIDDANFLPISINDVIYSHDFARALWGQKFINPELVDDNGSKVLAFQQTAWKHHLRQMVTADDPIAYLGGSL